MRGGGLTLLVSLTKDFPFFYKFSLGRMTSCFVKLGFWTNKKSYRVSQKNWCIATFSPLGQYIYMTVYIYERTTTKGKLRRSFWSFYELYSRWCQFSVNKDSLKTIFPIKTHPVVHHRGVQVVSFELCK